MIYIRLDSGKELEEDEMAISFQTLPSKAHPANGLP